MKQNQNGEILYWRDSSLYLNLTNNCSNDCVFCVRNYKEGVFGFNLKLDYDPSFNEILELLSPKLLEKFQEIVFTGFGEPLVRLDLVCKIAVEIKKMRNSIKIRIDTNGLAELLNPGIDVVTKLKNSEVDSLSISLNAENAQKYNEICRPKFGIDSFNAILKFADKAKKLFDVRFTIVDIPQINLDECKNLAAKMNIPLKIRPYNGPEIVL